MLQFFDWILKCILIVFFGGLLLLFEIIMCAVLGFFTAPWLGFVLGFIWFLVDIKIIKIFKGN
jgi:hypothetical protein